MCMGVCLHLWMSTPCVPSVYRRARLPELEFQLINGCHMDAGNRICCSPGPIPLTLVSLEFSGELCFKSCLVEAREMVQQLKSVCCFCSSTTYNYSSRRCNIIFLLASVGIHMCEVHMHVRAYTHTHIYGRKIGGFFFLKKCLVSQSQLI